MPRKLEELDKRSLLAVAELLINKIDRPNPPAQITIEHDGVRRSWSNERTALLELSKAFYKLNKGAKRGPKPKHTVAEASVTPDIIATAVCFLIERGMKPTEAENEIAEYTSHASETVHTYCERHKIAATNAGRILCHRLSEFKLPTDDDDLAVKRILMDVTIRDNGNIVTVVER